MSFILLIGWMVPLLYGTYIPMVVFLTPQLCGCLLGACFYLGGIDCIDWHMLLLHNAICSQSLQPHWFDSHLMYYPVLDQTVNDYYCNIAAVKVHQAVCNLLQPASTMWFEL